MRARIAAATAVAILVGSLGAAGPLHAVDGRGIRGALGVLIIPVAAMAVLLVVDMEGSTQPSSPGDLLECVVVAFVVMAARLEAGYLIGRFAAWLVGMRTTPKA